MESFGLDPIKIIIYFSFCELFNILKVGAYTKTECSGFRIKIVIVHEHNYKDDYFKITGYKHLRYLLRLSIIEHLTVWSFELDRFESWLSRFAKAKVCTV